MHDEDERHLGRSRDRGEIAQGIVTGVGIEVRVDRQRALMAERDRVTVGCCFRAKRCTDVALRAAAVIDDDLLTPELGQLRSEHTSEPVRSAARRKRHDEAHGFRGIALGRECRCHPERVQDDRQLR